MKRLLLSGALAVGMHGFLLTRDYQWTDKPSLYTARAIPIAISLESKIPQTKASTKNPEPDYPSPQSAPIINKKESSRAESLEDREESTSRLVKKPSEISKKPGQPPHIEAQFKKKEQTGKGEPQPGRIAKTTRQPTVPDTFYHSQEKSKSDHRPNEGNGDDRQDRAKPRNPPATLNNQSAMIPEPTGDSVRDTTPIYRLNSPPNYPRIARRKGYEGTVILEVLVGSEGNVTDCRIEKSSGHRVLDREAMRSVKRWLFEPGIIGNRKVEMWVTVPIRFHLN